MATIKTVTLLDELPVDVLLKLVGLVGTITPVSSEHAYSSELIELSTVSKGMRTACYKLLFRGVIVNWHQVSSMGKYDDYFVHKPDNNEIEFEGVPEGVEYTKSFALMERYDTRKGKLLYPVPWPLTVETMRRGAVVLSKVLSKANGLRKLSVTVPVVASRFNLRNAMGPEGVPHLPYVTQLVVDKSTLFLIESCPNITNVTFVGENKHDEYSGVAFWESFSHIARRETVETVEVDGVPFQVFPIYEVSPNFKHFTFVGELSGHRWISLLSKIRATLPSAMPNLVSLTLVIIGNEHAPSRAFKKFKLKRVAKHFAQAFLTRQRSLQIVTFARITYDLGRQNFPVLWNCWECVRGAGELEACEVIERNELDLAAPRFIKWHPTSEGPA
ncbi:hypothetical protein BKA81DRAFT_382426 [Phyllosticta paracitricarpa]|uniref:F-box domain-containing protein n=1 Tax=Phyllosticta paracitricarpa TaxID=2016321 RepID=A0ABR1MTZ3_9PEZI